MSSLSIFAGPTALQQLRQEGLRPDQVRVMVAASGGPKWFVLYGLDRYLFGEFFAGRREPLLTLGSSAGAWRMCCLATADPVAAIERLAMLYSRERYSAQPTPAEVTASARVMLHKVLGEEGARQIVQNQVFRTHIIADRCKGIGSSSRRWLQVLALGASATANAFSRRALSLFFQRTLFSNMGDLSPFSTLSDLDTALAELTEDNLYEVMIASGSIPFVLEGVRDIAGARKGLYWDGGITDYHFDMPFHDGPGLVLYPHFSPLLVPGWFDKHVPWRRIHEKNFHNVVLVTPSREFTAALPNARIPDRTDFVNFEYHARVRNWQQVLDASQRLGQDLADLVARGEVAAIARPLAERAA